MTGKDKRNRRRILARLHISNDEEFVRKVILDRDMEEYPDPFLQNIQDKRLLAAYRHRVADAINSYTPKSKDEREQIQEFRERERNRYNILRSKQSVPELEEMGVAPEIAELIRNLSFETGYLLERDIDWNAIITLKESTSLNTLRKISAYYRVKEQSLVSRPLGTKVRVINSIRFIRGDPTVSLENIIEFVPFERTKEKVQLENEDGEPVEPKKGMSDERVKRELRRVVKKNQTIPVALALANIKKITNYHHSGLPNGRYNHMDINLSSTMDKKPESKTGRNVVAHEFFHSLQDVMGTSDFAVGGDAVDFNAEPHNWKSVIFPETDQPLPDIQQKTKELWFKFRNEQIKPLCDYQTKNIDEMFAVAFEAYIENPQILEEEQPEVYKTIKTIVDLFPK